MDEKVLHEYFRLYSEGHYGQAINSICTEDAYFWNTQIEVVGRQKIIDWLYGSHRGYLEKLTPINILLEPDRGAVELDQEFHALEDISNFHIKPLKKNEVLKTRGICHFFLINHGKVTAIKEYVLLYKCNPGLFKPACVKDEK